MERRRAMISIFSSIIAISSGWKLFISWGDNTDIETSFKRLPHKSKAPVASNPNISVKDSKIVVTGVTWSGGSCEKTTITNVEYRNHHLLVTIGCVDKNDIPSLIGVCQPYMGEMNYKAIVRYGNKKPKKFTIIEKCGEDLENKSTKTL